MTRDPTTAEARARSTSETCVCGQVGDRKPLYAKRRRREKTGEEVMPKDGDKKRERASRRGNYEWASSGSVMLVLGVSCIEVGIGLRGKATRRDFGARRGEERGDPCLQSQRVSERKAARGKTTHMQPRPLVLALARASRLLRPALIVRRRC